MIDVLHLYVEAVASERETPTEAASEQRRRRTLRRSGPQIQLSRIYRLKSDAICIDCA